MIVAPLPFNERGRLAALRSYEILDTDEEEAFNALTRAAAQICNVPIALISLVDKDRQWFKSALGLPAEVRETPREAAFCAHAIHGTGPLVVPDASADPRFHDNPLVLGDPGIRMYAGHPLVNAEGYGLGTLCVIDRQARELTAAQRGALESLAQAAMALLEARRTRAALDRLQRATLEEVEAAKSLLARMRAQQPRDERCVQLRNFPASHFSGDAAAVARRPDGVLHALIADATGHGLAAAFAVMPVLDTFYAMTAKNLGIDAICAEANRKLKFMLPSGRFVAMAAVAIDEAAGRLAVWNGGLPAALMLDESGSVVARFASRHLPCGIAGAEEFSPELATAGWQPGFRLLLHSDGLTEATNPEAEAFGEQRLLDALAEDGADPAALIEERLRAFMAGTEPHDDLTYLVITAAG